jgi:hypothetical protein
MRPSGNACELDWDELATYGTKLDVGPGAWQSSENEPCPRRTTPP